MKIKKYLLTDTAPNLGLLIMRMGIGLMFIIHGYPKIMAGPGLWEMLGGQMGMLGIHFGLTFWGFMAAFAEAFGGLFLLLGLFTRPAAFLMLFTMMMAALMHLGKGDGLEGASHAIELGIVFLGILIAGAGKYSLDRVLFWKRK